MATILVTNASGLQGKAVAEELVKANFKVRALTRDSQKVDSSQYQVVLGSFDDVESLTQALQGVDAVYFKLPLIFDRELLLQYTRNFIQAAKVAQPKLVVFNSSIFVPQKPTGYIAFDVKLEAENLLKQSGLPVVYLHPRLYLDNLAAPWSVPAIIDQGVVPVAVAEEQQLSWISTYDLARFTVALLQRPELAGSTFEVGASPVSGRDIARELSHALNKNVSYVFVTPDEFESALRAPFGEDNAKAIANIYRHVLENPQDYIVNTTVNPVLGVQPVSLGQWVSNVPWQELNKQYASSAVVTAE
ncbi:NmrA family NAD(P)-binding protein [Desertivirga brevis]|uniref:NmrA family NAD(P)-binding protein n=1 Tax=Desertivirga brevis TaxID=2810310 RepID=UPI001A964F28|nr:NmrA family NAD(P)-binding protein [Pedobacter sp. SYSU D00873]